MHELSVEWSEKEQRGYKVRKNAGGGATEVIDGHVQRCPRLVSLV